MTDEQSHESTVGRRRSLVHGLLFAGASPLRLAGARTHAGIQAHVARAFEMRGRAGDMGDPPCGAAVVHGPGALGFGPSSRILDNDATAHADIVFVRDACTRLATRELGDCVMVSTPAPCPMCQVDAY